ncbi:hypothetical protein PR048_020155 [Dryococelus australis]|uniref:Uncharacterized protein n=1 Tax=Dryococelus australis TaxID=614101 RepID=A0ABQ9H5I3_9NEOP|nr:hypothetical protein PR048_020155 [Dryococelus australis]
MLGFEMRIYKASKMHKSLRPVIIFPMNVIHINCNSANDCYINGKTMNTMHKFAPMAPPGYKLVEVPKSIDYVPVIAKNAHEVAISNVDQEDKGRNHFVLALEMMGFSFARRTVHKVESSTKPEASRARDTNMLTRANELFLHSQGLKVNIHGRRQSTEYIQAGRI